MENKYKNFVHIQLASLTVLSGWYPFYYVKLTKETFAIHQNVNTYSYIKAGIRPGFFRSMIIPLSFQPIFPAVYGVSNILEKKYQLSSINSKFLGGALTAPIANALMTYQISAQNPVHSGKLIPAIKTVGINLFHGTLPMTFRNGFFSIGIFELYPFFENELKIYKLNVISSAMLAGIIPTLIASTLTMPFENIATQRQSIGAKIAPYRTTYEVIQNIIKQNGYRGMFVGGMMRFISAYVEIVSFNQILNFYKTLF